jgi:hypothetical protein
MRVIMNYLNQNADSMITNMTDYAKKVRDWVGDPSWENFRSLMSTLVDVLEGIPVLIPSLLAKGWDYFFNPQNQGKGDRQDGGGKSGMRPPYLGDPHQNVAPP